MRRQVIKFQRVMGPTAEVASKLANLKLPCVDNNARPFFKDVHDHVRRVENMVIGLRDIVTSVFEATNLLEQQRQERLRAARSMGGDSGCADGNRWDLRHEL